MKVPPLPAIVAWLAVRPEAGVWFRAIPPAFMATALSTAHTSVRAGRYNDASPSAPAYPILYLAENHMPALFEVQALFGSPTSAGGIVSHPRLSVTVLNVRVRLSRVADLTDLTQQAIFDTNAQELTGDWLGYRQRGPHTSITRPTGTAPTQALGATLYAVPDLEGFVTISARLSEQRVLVVFPGKLQPTSLIEHTDPTTGQVYPLT